MDNLGNEVIVKVKEAIRAKLKEMNANSSDEIIDYIMLLVTTKKSSTELAKSIDFVMENNTSIFVKWLTTVIKKLQQVTISTTEKNTPEGEKSFESNELKLAKYDENKISSPVKTNEIRPKICSSPKKAIKTKDIICISENNSCNKPLPEMKNTSVKSNSNIMNTEPNKNISYRNEKIDVKRKRPRISINSDDEEEKNVRTRVPITIKEPTKQITKEPLKKKNIISMSQVIVVKPTEFKKDICKTKEKLLMHDLIVQRVDHQRGALALDTAFKYIQQQIGASDKEIAIVKKWRDYAVEMLRSSKKIYDLHQV